MKEKFKRLPVSLQKFIAIRFGIAFILCLLIATAVINRLNYYVIVTLLAPMLIILIDAVIVLLKCTQQGCLTIQGVCTFTERAKLRGRVKSITIIADDTTLTLPIQRRIKSVDVGDIITLYLPANTPVYEREPKEYFIYNYYTFDVTAGFPKTKKKIKQMEQEIDRMMESD